MHKNAYWRIERYTALLCSHNHNMSQDTVERCSGWISTFLILCALWSITSEKGHGEKQKSPPQKWGGFGIVYQKE